MVPFSALFACHFLAVEHLSCKLSPAGEAFCFCVLCSASFLCSAFLCSAPFLWLCSAPFLLLSLCFFSLLCSALLTLLLWSALPLLFAVLFCLLLLCLFSCSSVAILPAALVSSGQLAKKTQFQTAWPSHFAVSFLSRRRKIHVLQLKRPRKKHHETSIQGNHSGPWKVLSNLQVFEVCFPGDEKRVRLYNINDVDLSLLLLLLLLLLMKLCLCLSEILEASSMHCLADSAKMFVRVSLCWKDALRFFPIYIISRLVASSAIRTFLKRRWTEKFLSLFGTEAEGYELGCPPSQ